MSDPIRTEDVGRARPARWRWLIVPAGLLAAGCPSLEPLPTQARVAEEVEAGTGRKYLLYVPSTYDDRRAWPLLLVCHGTWPYDTAELQMREWARFAEYRGILLAAPTLMGAKGDLPPEPAKQVELQQQDERLILGVVDEIRDRYRVAEERVFMTGWSAGAYSILYTGLRNPDVFRALAIRQGSFDERFMDIPAERLDRWQPIKVLYGRMDFLRDQTRASIRWLRDQRMFVEEEEITGSHRRIDPGLVWKFFEKVAKERPWIRLRARPARAGDPLTLQFSLEAIPPVTGRKWFFGDEGQSREDSPVHTYASPGRYEVTVNVIVKGGKKYTRSRSIAVGGG
jgi:predicted esterase